jgi:hypothetical protein
LNVKQEVNERAMNFSRAQVAGTVMLARHVFDKSLQCAVLQGNALSAASDSVGA